MLEKIKFLKKFDSGRRHKIVNTIQHIVIGPSQVEMVDQGFCQLLVYSGNKSVFTTKTNPSHLKRLVPATVRGL